MTSRRKTALRQCCNSTLAPPLPGRPRRPLAQPGELEPAVRTLNGGPDRPLAWLLAALLGLFLASSVPAYADVAAGQQAFDKGDYAHAMSEWQSAADKGDAEGQLGLGKLYEFGLGDLAQNYKRADFWYRKAADQNNAEAQYRLALIWAVGGDDFPPDLAEAYKWLVLAAE